MVLYHMDEKCFYAVVNRSKDKVVTPIGLEVEDNFVQHKNHVGKEMCIVINIYELIENDITNDGRVFPVAIIRASKTVKADKDKFKRVYRDDGTYYYPRILENKLRNKGELYFKSYELTG